MRHRLSVAALAALLAAASWPALAERPDPSGPSTAAARQAAWERHQELARASIFKGLEWRSVGPVVQGGRVVDIETVPGEPYTFYVAYAAGGLWRTRNNGVTFDPLFDDQPVMIMGDVAVDPSRPQTVWVGTGESNPSRSSYGGMGIFRSDDGGDTWTAMGLEDTDRISRVLVDPRRSDRVFAAAAGKLYTPGGDRGVFRTDDGGKSWRQVLAGGEWTGAIDLTMDPSNPDVLYAATWERSRRPWNFHEGGEGSGIWKTTDGGDHWTRLDGGLPHGEHVSRIGLAIAASRPATVYAVVDNHELLPEEQWDLGDGAITAKRLRKMTREELLAQDPEEIEDFIRNNDLDTSLDAEKLVAMVEKGEITLEEILKELDDANADLFETDIRGPEVWRSDDAGATWRRTHEQPIRELVYTYGYYFGQVRVSPADPERIYLLGVPMITSADGGRTFESLWNPQVHVDYHEMWLDPNFPDRMFVGNDGGIDVSYDGGKTWLKLDAQPVGLFYAITLDMAEPYNIYGGLQDNGSLKGSSRTRWELGERWTEIGGGDGMYVQVDPRDNATIYAGMQFGYYRRTSPDGPPAEVRPRDKLKEPPLRYNWDTPIQLSPHNADVLYFGANRLYRTLDQAATWEAISPDLTRSPERGNVPYATITTLAESPKAFGLLWAGTDDGYVQVSEDGGVEWREATDGLPRDRWVSRVEPSHHERDVAYVALNGYRDDDITPYLYRTADLGRTWTPIAAGLPAEAVNVVREDPVNPQVLYVGTDRGVYVTLDQGATWQGLGSGLPNVPVHDLAVHPTQRELVAGTHGRSAWVLDVLPVQEATAEQRQEKARLYPVENVEYDRGWKSKRSLWFERPELLPDVKIPFWTAAAGTARLEVRDGDGRPLRRLELEVAEPGVATFTWDLLLDEGLALAAERQRLAAAEAAEKEAAKKARKDKAGKGKKPGSSAEDGSEGAGPEKGTRAKTPWAETVRLERPLYVTPGDYVLELVVPGGEATTDLTVDPPEPRKPRAKPEPEIRGEKKEEGKGEK